MENTLVNGSNIFKIKWKFFTYRVVSYFSFLLIPVYVQKGMHIPSWLMGLMMTLYILFIVSQWFLLGKEIDHRLKIYFRVNSSIDRVVYRLLLGMFFFVMLFNLINLLDSKWIYNCYWITWAVLGLFYSWPTRGKIIQESVSSNFGEFKFLDNFEKTLLGLVVLMVIFSLPDLPPLVDIEMLKLYYDPLETIGNPIWNFLLINFYPFKSYPELFRLGWSLHFYLVGIGTFLLVFYAFLRFFVSRRLSLLGVFALISSWSFSKTLSNNIEFTLLTTYSLIWVWTLLWVTKSSTYRAGLFMGLVSFWGALINTNFGILAFFQIALVLGVFLSERTGWFKRQLMKYALFGFALTFFRLLSHSDLLTSLHMVDFSIFKKLALEIERKGFFVLALFGLVFVLIKYFRPKTQWVKELQIETESMTIFLSTLALHIVLALFWEDSMLIGFGMLWLLAFLSLIPLEFVFQSLSRMRSNRNMIYLVYILICLLDSHFEGRVKIFLKIFNN